jgi:hypothetical protein
VSGRVVFAGEVAGVGYVSIEPFAEPSTVVTVGGVTSPGVDAGAPVPRGARIGVAGVPGPVTLSVRRRVAGGEAEYLDPTPWLGRPPARLVPPGGGGARPPGGGLVCRVVRER